MGGRGASSGVTGRMVKSVVIDGQTVDLGNHPLKYGARDQSMSQDVRKAVDDFERRRTGAKVEHGTLIDANGNVLTENRGGKGSVSMPVRLYDQAVVMSHNHPREDGSSLGGTFSQGDIDTFATTKTKTMRATAGEGVYSISKGANFDAAGLRKYRARVEADARAEYRRKNAQAWQDFEAHKIGYAEYSRAADRNFNEYLVTSHNALLAGQKQYGYTYTLEKRN